MLHRHHKMRRRPFCSFYDRGDRLPYMTGAEDGRSRLNDLKTRVTSIGGCSEACFRWLEIRYVRVL